MRIAALKVKIMPESVETDLKKLKKEVEIIVNSLGAKIHSTEEEEIAFGLKAIFIKMAWPEEKSTDIIENKLIEIENVSSVKLEDYRRAFG